MRKWIIIALLLGVAYGSHRAWQASKPVVAQVSASIGGSVHDGTGDSYRELGGIDITRWKYRHWFQKRSFVTRSACIVTDQPHTKFRARDARPSGESSVKWGADIGVIGNDSRTVLPKITVWIEYDFLKGTATLLNTGETLPLSADKVYTVYLNHQFAADRFVAHQTGEKVAHIHPKLAESFADAEKIAEQVAP